MVSVPMHSTFAIMTSRRASGMFARNDRPHVATTIMLDDLHRSICLPIFTARSSPRNRCWQLYLTPRFEQLSVSSARRQTEVQAHNSSHERVCENLCCCSVGLWSAGVFHSRSLRNFTLHAVWELRPSCVIRTCTIRVWDFARSRPRLLTTTLCFPAVYMISSVLPCEHIALYRFLLL